MITSPTQISNCVVWLDATDTTTLSSLSGGAGNSLINTSLTGDFVGGWGDKSPNNRHFTNIGGSASTRPTWIAALSTVRFDGVNDYLTFIGNITYTAQTVFVVTAPRVYVDRAPMYTQAATAAADNATYLPLALGTPVGSGVGSYTSSGFASVAPISYRALSTFDVFTSFHTGTNITNLRNGGNTGSFAVNLGNLVTTRSRIGSWIDYGGIPFYFYNGDISEVIVYDKALSSAEREDVEYYLTRKWSFLNVIPRQVYAIQNGNWSNSTTWSTSADPAPWTFPLSSDNVYSNTFTVTADQNVRVTSLQTAALSPNIAAGGTFAIAQPNITIAPFNGFTTAGTTACITGLLSSGTSILSGNIIGPGVSHTGNGELRIIGSVAGGSIAGANGIVNRSTGSIAVTGDIIASSLDNTSGRYNLAILNESSGNVSVRGNVGSSGNRDKSGIRNNSSGTVTIVGSVSSSNSGGGTVEAIRNDGTGNIVVFGNVTSFGVNDQGGGSHGINNNSAGNVYVTGNLFGPNRTSGTHNTNNYTIRNGNIGTVILSGDIFAGDTIGSSVVFQNSTGTLIINGNIYASANGHGVVSANTGARNEFTGSLVNDISGRQAVYVARYLLRPQMFNSFTRMAGPSATNTPIFYYAPESYSTSFVPHTSSVRAGVTYAAVSALSGVAVNIPVQLVGTMQVPSPASVSFNVPVESTTGTGIVSPASLQELWSVSLDNIKTSNSLGTRLRNVATIQEVGDLLAYGSITITPDTIPGLQLWLDATNGLLNSAGTLATTNGELIATWLDRSGNNRHAKQTTNSARPTLLTNALNGKNCAFFDGTEWMQGISFPNLTNYTMFAVYRRKGTPSSGSGFVFCTGVDGNLAESARLTQLIYHNSTVPTPGYNAFGWPVKVTPSNNLDIHLLRNDNFNIHSCTASLSSGTGEYRLNSTSSLGSINFTPVSTSTGSMIYTLGTRTWGQTDVNFMANCDIAEVLVYNTTFNASQRQIVETYLNNKWRIY